MPIITRRTAIAGSLGVATPEVFSTRYRTVDRVSIADAPVVTAATATAAHGAPTLTIA